MPGILSNSYAASKSRCPSSSRRRSSLKRQQRFYRIRVVNGENFMPAGTSVSSSSSSSSSIAHGQQVQSSSPMSPTRKILDTSSEVSSLTMMMPSLDLSSLSCSSSAFSSVSSHQNRRQRTKLSRALYFAPENKEQSREDDWGHFVQV